jgi:hypothetical protein
MAIWTNVPDSNLEPGDPIRSVDIIAIKDNTTALAEGASGAPEIYQKATQFSAKGQVFTSNGTFTIPTGVTRLKVTVVGGGGAGAASFASGCQGYAGAGGGGGGAAIKWLTVTGGTLAVTVGSGGQSSSVASGTQSITTISATAGSAGNQGLAGAGGIGSNGDLNIRGGAGQSAYFEFVSGSGGNSILGGGGQGVLNGTTAGGAYGGGGAGHGVNLIAAGGAGAAGVLIFEW